MTLPFAERDSNRVTPEQKEADNECDNNRTFEPPFRSFDLERPTPPSQFEIGQALRPTLVIVPSRVARRSFPAPHRIYLRRSHDIKKGIA